MKDQEEFVAVEVDMPAVGSSDYIKQTLKRIDPSCNCPLCEIGKEVLRAQSVVTHTYIGLRHQTFKGVEHVRNNIEKLLGMNAEAMETYCKEVIDIVNQLKGEKKGCGECDACKKKEEGH